MLTERKTIYRTFFYKIKILFTLFYNFVHQVVN